MKRKRDGLLLWAIGISLALHVTVAVAGRGFHDVEARDESPPTVIDVDRLARHTPPPTPTPPPQARPAAAAPRAVAAAPRVHPPASDNHGTSGPVEPGPPVGPSPGEGGNGPEGTAEPAPTDTPRPACATPNVAAHAIDAVTAEAPDGLEGQAGTTQVMVTLSAGGGVVGTSIYRSAGNLLMDRAALAAARASTFAPEIRDCQPVGGSYLFTVQFTGNQ